MSLFFFTFVTIYGGMHAYFFFRARPALDLGATGSCLLALFLAVMAAAPLTLRIVERHASDTTARIFAWSAYLWMGFLFFFFVLSLSVDTYRLVHLLATALISRPHVIPLPMARAAFWLPAAVSVAICVYAWFEALEIRTEKVTIATAKLPPGISRLRIVQITDVHVGLIVREERLARMVARVREAAPDLLVSTGDLLDGQPDGYAASAGLLREIRPRFGKFAITGNHEFYVGMAETEAFVRDAGFTLLRGKGQNVAGVLNIAGVDDPAGGRTGISRRVNEVELLRRLPRERFTLLLKHRPVVGKASTGLFDLQLSGHVHKGQLFPFNLVTHLFYPVRMGLSAVGNGSSLYVSRGTGTWGPPLRFLAPPEVTVIDLVRTP